MQTETQKSYFAAANTFDGFISYFNDIFGKLKKIYVIKGGPGTGKSQFMKQISRQAELQQYKVDHFYCSFDPNSLDGIIINNDYAIIDGTAPHIYEPRIPGAVDEILDLSQFWDKDVLIENKSRLQELNEEKSRCFSLMMMRILFLVDIIKNMAKHMQKLMP